MTVYLRSKECPSFTLSSPATVVTAVTVQGADVILFLRLVRCTCSSTPTAPHDDHHPAQGSCCTPE